MTRPGASGSTRPLRFPPLDAPLGVPGARPPSTVSASLVITASIRPRRLRAGFASVYGAWLLPATAVALAVTVGALALGGAGIGAVLLSIAGAAATLGGKFQMDHEDLGMMETVEVVREMPRPHPRPDTRTGGAAAHGHGTH